MLTTCPLARRSHRANASAILKSRRARRVTLLGLYYSARPLSIGARDLRASNSRQLQLGRKLGHPRNVSFTSIPTVWGIWGSGRISFRRALQLRAGWFLTPLVSSFRQNSGARIGTAPSAASRWVRRRVSLASILQRTHSQAVAILKGVRLKQSARTPLSRACAFSRCPRTTLRAAQPQCSRSCHRAQTSSSSAAAHHKAPPAPSPQRVARARLGCTPV